MRNSAFALICLLLACCSQPEQLPSLGDKTVEVFAQTNLFFDMALKGKTEPNEAGIIRLDAGRVILKKVVLPEYALQPKVTATLTLTSNGDPWDKSGSLFVLPASSDVDLLDFEKGDFDLQTREDAYPGVMPFSTDSFSYQPPLELIRFMTPFGVGHFNDDKRVASLKPVYIPEWEDKVVWNQDITQLLPVLEGEVYIGAYIDTWTKEGYNLSLELNLEESSIPQHKKKKTSVLSLVNTVKYSGEQLEYDGFAKEPLLLEFELAERVKSAQLFYTTTGHGSAEMGDEFNPRENKVHFDGKEALAFTPWRDDCASFRRFNPSSGVWTKKTVWRGDSIEERIASSDYSRSNWCPGSQVLPEMLDLGSLEKGKHSLKIDIPEAKPRTEEEFNYWMVSAYLVCEHE